MICILIMLYVFLILHLGNILFVEKMLIYMFTKPILNKKNLEHFLGELFMTLECPLRTMGETLLEERAPSFVITKR